MKVTLRAPDSRARRTGAILFVLGTAMVVGFLVAAQPIATVVLSGAAGLAGWLLLQPLGLFPASLLLGMIVIPSVLLEARNSTLSLPVPFLGQATLVLVVAAFSLVRVVWRPLPRPRPKLAWAAVALAIYAAATLLAALVAALAGNAGPGMADDLRRHLAYLAAFPIGYIAAALPEERGRLYRGLAMVTVVASAFALFYWAWASGVVRLVRIAPFLDALMWHASEASAYAGNRSVYPFSDDSPNVSAVIFAGLAGLTAPHLLSSDERRDKVIALTVVAFAGAAVLTTQSRAGIVAFVAAILAYLLLVPGFYRRLAFAALALFSAAVLIGFSLLPAERGFSPETPNLLARQAIWGQGVDVFLRSPLVGHGYGYSAEPRFVEPRPSGPELNSIHNELLGRLIDGGLVGGLAFVVVAAIVVRSVLSLLRRPTTFFQGVGLACFLVALATSMAAGSTLRTAVAAILFWLAFGMSTGTLTPAATTTAAGGGR